MSPDSDWTSRLAALLAGLPLASAFAAPPQAAVVERGAAPGFGALALSYAGTSLAWSVEGRTLVLRP